jgi:hypothetical protein
MKMPGSGMAEGILANAAQGPDALHRRLQEGSTQVAKLEAEPACPCGERESAGSKPENERSKWMRSDFLS